MQKDPKINYCYPLNLGFQEYYQSFIQGFKYLFYFKSHAHFRDHSRCYGIIKPR